MMFAATCLVGGDSLPPLIPVKVAGEGTPMPSHLDHSRGSSWLAPANRIAGWALAFLLAATTNFPATILCAQDSAQASQPASSAEPPATGQSQPAAAPTDQTQPSAVPATPPAAPPAEGAPATSANPSSPGSASQPAPADQTEPPQPADRPASAPAPQEPAAATSAPQGRPAPEPEAPPLTEDDLRHLLIGKDLFLRGGYLDNNLEFDEHGQLISHSPKGSYTLCAIRVTRVRLMKHKVELEGERYGLHFLGALPGDDPTSAFDRVNITPKKKPVRITIDRELVVKEKPQKQPKPERRGKKFAPPAAKAVQPAAKPAEAKVTPAPEPAPTSDSGPAVGDNMQVTVNLAPDTGPAPNTANSEQSSQTTPALSANSAPAAANAANPNSATAAQPGTTAPSPSPAAASAPQPSSAPAAPPSSETSTAAAQESHSAKPDTAAATASTAPNATPETPSAASDAEQAQTEIAQAPAAERPADAKSITTTHSQGHANQLLEKAVDNVFSVGLDPRMMATLPGYWKPYYQQADDAAPAWPSNPSVLRQSAVDKKARLVSVIDPTSNQYAQDHGVAGIAEYHVVVGSDGKPSDIAVARPIGFGLDETAVESLSKATFEPAMKDGHAVPVALDLVVEFRIYSKLTAEASKPHPVENPDKILPGPYSVQH